MPRVEITSEQEQSRGWIFTAQIIADDGSLQRHRLRLSWADYNHWSIDGVDPPEAVAEAVITFLISRTETSSMPESIDAATIRRQHAGADEAIRGMLR